jgi:formiminotetrahydrofolate cyclodeaminase
LQQISDLSITAYVTELASSAATPGGGSAAGLTAVQAAALLSMVCNLSTGDKYAGVSDRIGTIGHACESIRKLLLELTDRDARVFSALMASYKLPRNNPEESGQRTARIQESLQSAAGVPLQVMKETIELAPHATELGEIGNPNLITDVGVAVHLMEAALSSARLNVLINTRLVRNSDFVADCETQMSEILDRFSVERTRCLDAVEDKLPG